MADETTQPDAQPGETRRATHGWFTLTYSLADPRTGEGRMEYDLWEHTMYGPVHYMTFSDQAFEHLAAVVDAIRRHS